MKPRKPLLTPIAVSAIKRRASKNSPWRKGPMHSTKRAQDEFARREAENEKRIDAAFGGKS